MRQRLLVLVLVTLALGAVPAWADPIVPVGGGTVSWSSWNAAQIAPASYGTHFWNNFSQDVGECNVGYWISNTGGCGDSTTDYDFYDLAPLDLATLPNYFANGDGAEGFYFDSDGTEVVSVTLNAQVSAWTETGNSLGWYQRDGLGGGVLFGPNPAIGSTATFTPSGDYGFYLTSQAGTFTTEATDNFGLLHFAAFLVDPATGKYFVGVEDNIGSLADYDYNDKILTVTSQPVPEPGSLMLMALGLGGLAAARRRTKK